MNTIASRRRSRPTPIVQVVILAAGMGTRLGRAAPKPLTPIHDGRTILGQQLDNIGDVFGKWADVTLVVGHNAEQLIDAAPDTCHVHNSEYDVTNTSKSLLLALRAVPVGGVLWMNGDVVFDPEALRRATPLIAAGQSFVTVDRSVCGDEEVKYTLDNDGNIDGLSKTVRGGLGEAVGINYVSGADRKALIKHLARVPDQAYFERGIELAIRDDGSRFAALDITGLYAVEVDDESDLVRANTAAASG